VLPDEASSALDAEIERDIVGLRFICSEVMSSHQTAFRRALGESTVSSTIQQSKKMDQFSI
jgi:hypothetical protein